MSGITETRSGAFLSMTSPLGPDVLIPARLVAEEAISAPFHVRLEIVSTTENIDPNTLLNNPVCVTIQRSAGINRYFHGAVREFSLTGQAQRGFWSYVADIVPKFWFLEQTGNCATYENKTAKDIITALLSSAGITDYEFRLYGAPSTREFTVQYNESDFAFASRLMEEEGWSYFFEHSSSAHLLVISDANGAFKPVPDASFNIGATGVGTWDCLSLWRPALATAYGKVQLADYDPVTPDTDLFATQSTTLATGGAATRSLFHWSARSFDTGEVSARSRRRIEAAECAAALTEAAGINESLYPGGKLTVLKDPYSGAENVDYVVRSISHDASDDSWAATGGKGTDYSNRFTAFPAKTLWRPAIVSPQPRMDGLYSAIVIGPDGEEIYTDDLGRVKIRFKWDHANTATAGGSCWVRVVQPWAGNGWGWQHLPRIGSEVAVAFINGDPDSPVITGGLYNGDQKPPFTLPGQKNISGLRTRSTTGGGTADYSELSFDDTAGSEKVLLHAQYDLATEVEHDETLTVQNNRTKKVSQNEQVEIGNSQTIKVANGRTTTINAGGDALKVEGGDHTLEVSTGNISWQASAGAITGEAMQSIELKVGANSIKIDQTGVTISATMIKITGQAMVQVQAPMATVNADGMLTLKGGIMMLN